MTREITIRSRDGLTLEAALDEPEQSWGLVILCHPHPQMGGTMNAPLLLALRDEMVERGWVVLRFNFRGIGASEGVSGDGVAEVADAGGAVDYAFEHFRHLPRAIAGWSFGAVVAIRLAAEELLLRGCVAIAPPVQEKPGITAGLPPARKMELLVPVLVIVGSNDEQVSPGECAEWSISAGVEILPFPGANHFFWAKYDALAGTVGDWIQDKLLNAP
ncbi:MAG TPA: alpha/beta family hydrolase [Actinomycetota bacterium]|nr:alpha/beta family hydrolase [Actinomycetota bacterium]